MNLGFVSKKKVEKLLNECEKNHGVRNNDSYVVPEDKNGFYFDMGAQSTVNYLRNGLQIKSKN